MFVCAMSCARASGRELVDTHTHALHPHHRNFDRLAWRTPRPREHRRRCFRKPCGHVHWPVAQSSKTNSDFGFDSSERSTSSFTAPKPPSVWAACRCPPCARRPRPGPASNVEQSCPPFPNVCGLLSGSPLLCCRHKQHRKLDEHRPSRLRARCRNASQRA